MDKEMFEKQLKNLIRNNLVSLPMSIKDIQKVVDVFYDDLVDFFGVDLGHKDERKN